MKLNDTMQGRASRVREGRRRICMKLKGRLKAIAEMVPSCRIMCDIGTDHAYIPIYLLEKRICKKAIAVDLRGGPLITARKNIQEHGFERDIETRIGHGLQPVEENEIEVIVVAGMGGLLICDILSEGKTKAMKASKLILQPMNAIEIVREWLFDNLFSIASEKLVKEGGKIYNIIAAEWTGVKSDVMRIHHHIGEKLIDCRDPLLGEYISRKIKQLDKVISGLEKSCSPKTEIVELTGLRNEMKGILEKIDKDSGVNGGNAWE